MNTISTTLPLSPGHWTLDPVHCTVEFTARHMAISKVRGRFHDFDATVTIGEKHSKPRHSPPPSTSPQSTPTTATATPTYATQTSSTSTPTRK